MRTTHRHMDYGWRRHAGRGVAALVLTAMLAPALPARADNGGELTDRAEHSDLDFGEYEYARMDEADFDAILVGLDELIQDTANAEAVDEVITAAEDWYNEMSRNYTIAYIHSDLVADDPYWDDEVLYYDEMGTSVGDKVGQMYKQIALSPCTDVMHARVTEDEWEDILDYENLTDEQKELSKRETELELSYDTLYNKSYTTLVDGKSYDEDGLESAVDGGTIDFGAYLKGLADIGTQRNQELAELYLELVDVRTQLARSKGYDNYADYAYDKGYDRDFTPEDLAEYREDVKNYMVPLAAELQEVMYDDEHYDLLREMFSEPISEAECLEKLRAHLPDISDDMLVSLDYMEDHHLYDLSVSSEKAPGGYTISISGYNAPFMFNCADGSYEDLRTLVHEFGHYNQMYYMTEDSWYYDETDLDLAEIHSQGLEMLYLDYAEDLYGEYAEISTLYGLFNMVYACVEGVKEDAFQYAVYSEPDGLSVDRLNELYATYCEEYGDSDYYNSYYFGQYGVIPSGQIYEWVEVPHTFQSPMYYISYSVSVAAVMELYDEILDDRQRGIDIYLALVDAEFQDSYQNTVEEVGLNNPITNPRFDVYAENIRYTAGLTDTRQESGASVEDGAVDDPAGRESVTDGGSTQSGAGDEGAAEDEGQSSGGRRGRRNGEDDDGSGAASFLILRYVLIAAALCVAIVAVVVVVALASSRKKKQQLQYVPQQVQYTPQGPSGTYPQGSAYPQGPNGAYPQAPGSAYTQVPGGANTPPQGSAAAQGQGSAYPQGQDGTKTPGSV